MRKYLYVLMAVAAAACGQDEMQPAEEETGNGDEPKTYTVALAMNDENVEIEQEPLGRAAEGTNDLYWFQINQTPEAGGSSSYYAYGIFDKKENMTVKLVEGYTYSIEASLIKDGRDKLKLYRDSCWCPPVKYYSGGYTTTNKFVITPNRYVESFNGYYGVRYTLESFDSYSDYTSYPENIDRYCGYVGGYVPVENGKIAINMYRFVFGYRVEVNPFEEGKALVSFLDKVDTIYPGTEVTKIEREIAWNLYDSGAYTLQQYGQDTTAYGMEQMNGISTTANLTVRWISADGSRETVVYNKSVGIQRLKRSIFRITLKKGVAQNGSLQMNVENAEVVEGAISDIEGNIGGGVDTDIETGK
ncbi:hypothetical protein [uncultured Butyricimonas sp.]|uniref:hypothetical protein n=1 Tax=uncultured Butyricimonas sp. TaxID=1268785 RepID=UPI0026DDAE18|nr:hypothetical protein [uncultured Butyricimonas sp.]